jgi:hypothetical protein
MTSPKQFYRILSSAMRRKDIVKTAGVFSIAEDELGHQTAKRIAHGVMKKLEAEVHIFDQKYYASQPNSSFSAFLSRSQIKSNRSYRLWEAFHKNPPKSDLFKEAA